MLISIIGDIRQGKTLLMCKLAFLSKRNIYSNFWLDIKRAKDLSVDDLVNFNIPDNTDMFIDEAYTWLESRTSQKDINRIMSYILFQSGKRTLDIYLTAQLFSTVDIRFRQMSNIIIRCFKNDFQQFFQYFVYKNYNGVMYYISTFLFPFAEAEKYYTKYDTLEIVEPYGLEKIQNNFLLDHPKELYDYCFDIAQELIDDGISEITHSSLKVELLKRKISLKFEPYIYSIHKDDKKLER